MNIVRRTETSDRDHIRNKLIAHNLAQLPPELHQPKEEINFVLEDQDGEILGGVAGTIYWQHLHVDFLWVDPGLRHQGHGSALLKRIEEFAREKACRLVVLDTLSFQAPGFYEKNGYRVFGTIEDHPKGFNQYYLEKRLE